jgi:hypothetical protein
MTSLQQTAMGGGSTTAKTASYVLVAADAGTVVQMNSASATTITVNTALFAAGDTVQIQNVGAGVCTVTAGTATVSTSAVLALKQYDAGSLYFNTTSAALFFAADAADNTSPLTTKGDIYTFSTTNDRLPVGTNNQTLVADSTASTGLKWAAPTTAGYVGVSCRRETTGLALVNGTQVVIPYPSIDGWDTNGFHDPASNNTRITIPTGYGGKYLFTFTVADITVTPGYIYSVLKVNGTNVTTGFGVVTSTYPSNIKSTDVLQMSLVLVLSAADYVEIAIQTDRTATDNISSTFQATYLGA